MNLKQISKKYVTRSRFQKEVEKNKKLLSDIKLLCQPFGKHTADKILLMAKWKKRFDDEQLLNNLLRDYAKNYYKKHPEKRIKKITPPPAER